MTPEHPISKALCNPKAAGEYICSQIREKILKIRDRLWLKFTSKIGRNVIYKKLNEYEAQFYCTTLAELEYYNTNFHNERSILSHALSQASENDVFYDIGSNTGLYACFVGQIAAETIAIEPQPANYHRLQENLDLNNINSKSFELALSDSNTMTSLCVDPRGLKPGAGRSRISRKQEEHGSIEVETKTCSSLISDRNLPAPSMIKIDVEGAEMQVLNGMKDVLAQNACHTVYCEVHDINNQPSKHVHDYLESLDFNIESVPKGSQNLLIATKVS